MAFMGLLQAVDKSLPARHSIIPGTRQKFLHMQDFHTTTWGDLFAIPLLISAFAHLLSNGYIGVWQWFIFVIIALVDGIGFLEMCLTEKHKPDQGYPRRGVVSWHGLSHLPYHGVCVAMIVLSIGQTVIGNLYGPVLYVSLFGGALYIAAFIADIRAGNFDPLKKEAQDDMYSGPINDYL
jgi:predicted small integral membrane protein